MIKNNVLFDEIAGHPLRQVSPPSNPNLSASGRFPRFSAFLPFQPIRTYPILSAQSGGMIGGMGRAMWGYR